MSNDIKSNETQTVLLGKCHLAHMMKSSNNSSLSMKYINIILLTGLWCSVVVVTVSCLEPDLETAAGFPFSLSPSPLRLALGVSDLCPPWINVSVDERFKSSGLYTTFCKQRLDSFIFSNTTYNFSCNMVLIM